MLREAGPTAGVTSLSVAAACANALAAHRRAEAKRKEIEARQFKERLAERQETLEEKRQKKAEEEAVSVFVFYRPLALCRFHP